MTDTSAPEILPPRALYCFLCGGSQRYRPRDADRYARRGWPVCCGEVMSLYPVPHEPGVRGTASQPAPGRASAPE